VDSTFKTIQMYEIINSGLEQTSQSNCVLYSIDYHIRNKVMIMKQAILFKMMVLCHVISNGNRTEWSTIQGVIRQLSDFKLAECVA